MPLSTSVVYVARWTAVLCAALVAHQLRLLQFSVPRLCFILEHVACSEMSDQSTIVAVNDNTMLGYKIFQHDWTYVVVISFLSARSQVMQPHMQAPPALL
jgi:hypothetical protein